MGGGATRVRVKMGRRGLDPATSWPVPGANDATKTRHCAVRCDRQNKITRLSFLVQIVLYYFIDPLVVVAALVSAHLQKTVWSTLQTAPL